MVRSNSAFTINKQTSSQLGILLLIPYYQRGFVNIVHYPSTKIKWVWKSIWGAEILAFSDVFMLGSVYYRKCQCYSDIQWASFYTAKSGHFTDFASVWLIWLIGYYKLIWQLREARTSEALSLTSCVSRKAVIPLTDYLKYIAAPRLSGKSLRHIIFYQTLRAGYSVTTKRSRH